MTPLKSHNLRDFASFTYRSTAYRLQANWRRRRGLVEAFNDRKIVLTVTASRTGSDALTHRIGLLPRVTSIHEPQPHYKFVLRKAQRNPALAAGFFAQVKVPALLGFDTEVVAESNHLFGKGFLAPCLAMGFRPALVFLRRDATANAISLLRKNAIPGRTVSRQRYVIAPEESPYLPLADSAGLNDFQLCYWYCLEMHHRADLYRRVCDDLGLMSFALETGSLNDPGILSDMVHHLGLADAESVRGVFTKNEVGRVVNAVASHKKTMAPEIDIDKAIAEVEARLGAPAGVDAVHQRIAALQAALGRKTYPCVD